jgi:hypothetical protein
MDRVDGDSISQAQDFTHPHHLIVFSQTYF